MLMNSKGRFALVAAALAVMAGALAANAQQATTAIDADGNIVLPAANYQRDWTMLGVWAHPGKDGGVAKLNVVYTQPETVSAYKSTGAFPPGAVLIKELRGAGPTADAKSTAASLGDLTGWFVMVKPGDGAAPTGPLWGDGWGWAKFDANDPKTTVSTDYRTECLECHMPVKSTDWVHVDGYPLFRE